MFRDHDDGDEAMRRSGMASVRWAFKFGSWHPTQQEWMLAAQCVQPEEKQRIDKFMFKKDGKSSMVRMLYNGIVACLSCDPLLLRVP